jgi:alpha-tubulin suppressor-like RCC1 family protein
MCSRVGFQPVSCTILRSLDVVLMFRYNLINPNEPGVQRVQYPVNASWLKDVALRDLALHERHAACVDARGDVYQWGDGFFGSSPTSKSEPQEPRLTLRGHVRRFTLREGIVTQFMIWSEHHPASAYRIPNICSIGLGENIRHRG